MALGLSHLGLGMCRVGWDLVGEGQDIERAVQKVSRGQKEMVAENL